MIVSSLVVKTLKHLHRAIGFLKTEQGTSGLEALEEDSTISDILSNHAGLFCEKYFLECCCFLQKLLLGVI